MRRRAKPAKVKAEAKRLPSDQSRKKPVPTLRELETRLAEALEQLQRRSSELVEAQEQQTATSEILRVINQAPTDIEPVFHTVIASAIRLARGDYGGISLLQNDVFHLAASQGLDEGLVTFQRVIVRGSQVLSFSRRQSRWRRLLLQYSSSLRPTKPRVVNCSGWRRERPLGP